MSIARLTELMEVNSPPALTAIIAGAIATNPSNTKHQILVEVILTATGAAHVPDAGTLTVQGKPSRSAAYMDVVGGLGNLTSAPYFQIFNGSFDSLQFTPASLDGDCSYVVKYSGWR